jgi:predicted Zn-dependent protease
VLQGQNTDEKLAAQFYEDGEFDKAVVLYKKLFKNTPSSMYIYENYLNCLISLEEEQGATKLVQKQIRKFPGKYYYVVDLGFVYSQFGHKEKANQYFKQIIEDNTRHKELVNMLAQAFIKRDLNEMAVMTFEQATNRHGLLSFSSPLMSLYKMSNNTKDLTDLALEVIGKDKNKYEEVMRKLDIAYNHKESAEYLQKQTLYYIQKNPNKIIYEELLLEIFLQQKKYNAALRQVISIDKRKKEKGLRVKALADVCVHNEAYDAAVKGYEYVIKLGPESLYYLEAEKGLINSLYLKTTTAFQPKKEEVQLLISHINKFLESNGKSYQTAAGMYQLAELQIFYNDHVDEGIRILEEITKTPRLRATFLAKSKILLGDAYLIKNEIWDAKLMYGQVDKDFKEEALGQEAKFKSAKLSYYTGDFEWAKSQLEILKTATSQLISNNALELSLLIQDNIGLDSTEDAMKEYASAEFYLAQNKIDKCEELLNMLPFKYPNHTLNDEIYFLKAKVKEKQGKFIEANSLYNKIYTNYGDDILADNALYRSANIYLHILNQPQEAEALFEKILLEYNSSLFAVNSRKLYYGLKEGKSKEELFFEGL